MNTRYAFTALMVSPIALLAVYIGWLILLSIIRAVFFEVVHTVAGG